MSKRTSSRVKSVPHRLLEQEDGASEVVKPKRGRPRKTQPEVASPARVDQEHSEHVASGNEADNIEDGLNSDTRLDLDDALSHKLDNLLQSKMSVMMNQLKVDLFTEMKGHQPSHTSKESSGKKHKRKSTGDGKGESSSKSHPKKSRRQHSPEISDIGSEDSDDTALSTRSVVKLRKKGARGRSSHTLDIDSASEEEDWASSRNKFGYLVGHNLARDLKKKIKNDEFVEMADLLPSADVSSSKDDVVMKLSDNGVRFAKARAVKFISIEQWNQAFSVYQSIYIETATTLAEAILLSKQLLTYQRDINTFARRRESWFLYDKHFRKDRAASSDITSFADIRHDLLLDLNSSNNRKSAERYYGSNRDNYRGDNFRSNRRFSSGANNNRGRENPSSGVCFAFNEEGKRCTRTRCQFKHQCSKCGAYHPSFLCGRATAATENLVRLQRSVRDRSSINQPRPVQETR